MSAYHDITGWCVEGRHDRCSGVLRDGTGYHWWCACPHHQPISTADDLAENYRKAWTVWRKARNAQESA